jgi:hypothetical protein
VKNFTWLVSYLEDGKVQELLRPMIKHSFKRRIILHSVRCCAVWSNIRYVATSVEDKEDTKGYLAKVSVKFVSCFTSKVPFTIDEENVICTHTRTG